MDQKETNGMLADDLGSGDLPYYNKDSKIQPPNLTGMFHPKRIDLEAVRGFSLHQLYSLCWVKTHRYGFPKSPIMISKTMRTQLTPFLITRARAQQAARKAKGSHVTIE